MLYQLSILQLPDRGSALLSIQLCPAVSKPFQHINCWHFLWLCRMMGTEKLLVSMKDQVGLTLEIAQEMPAVRPCCKCGVHLQL